ncbi:FDFT1, partial [Symbiodinium microadriaticum]
MDAPSGHKQFLPRLRASRVVDKDPYRPNPERRCPSKVWKSYACSNDLGEFALPTAHAAGARLAVKAGGENLAKGVGEQALLCLNDLVADALELVPDSLECPLRLETPSIYRFCAIPQVMAIATLAACFDNPLVFTGVVKIRKGLTARLIVACCDGP